MGSRLLHRLVNVKMMLPSVGFSSARPARAVLGATLIVSLLMLATAGAAGASTVYAWGFYESKFLKAPTSTHPSALSSAVHIAVGNNHRLALLSNGTVAAWGAGGDGQIGAGSQEFATAPVLVRDAFKPYTPGAVLSNVTQVAAGGDFSLALLNGGKVVAWGSNSFGQLGIGPPEGCGNARFCAVVPKVVAGIGATKPAKQIAAGYDFSLALLSDGTVMSWGDNNRGQLGDGHTYTKPFSKGSPPARFYTPTTVPGLSGVTQVAAGGAYNACSGRSGGIQTGHSLALLRDGKVAAWGANCRGQAGKSHGQDVKTPVEVPGITHAAEVAAGGEQSLALLRDGTVMAWGSDQYGQLGNGTASPGYTSPGHSTPVHVMVRANGGLAPLGGVVRIAATEYTSYALTRSGTVWAWGKGRLGDGKEQDSSTAVQVAIPANMTVHSIAVGSSADYQLAIARPG